MWTPLLGPARRLLVGTADTGGAAVLEPAGEPTEQSIIEPTTENQTAAVTLCLFRTW